MIKTPRIHARPGDPDFVDLNWTDPISSWTTTRLVTMPEGIHRHEVVFVAYSQGVYAIKEMPLSLAQHEYEMLRTIETSTKHVARAVGLVERPWVDEDQEWSAAVITAYVPHAFPYRQLVSGIAFGKLRTSLLDALAGLLVELHLHGVYWGDCSLSNTLYRWDASAIEAVMIDAETTRVYPQISRGQRMEDLAIMEMNLAGEMADIAAANGATLDDADIHIGADITTRYAALWKELTTSLVVTAGDHFKIRNRIDRLNELGFAVDDIDLVPVDDGVNVKIRVKVGGRQYHSEQLRQVTGIDVSENQARSILSDLAYFDARFGGTSPTRKAVGAMRWRATVFEPLILAIVRDLAEPDPYQAYCDFLAYRLKLATKLDHDVENEDAYERWSKAGFPGSTTPG
ncbi:MAG: DUF4032 domain-containing protein [Acidimicrobiia bacterium]|nr:MAG: DUF4032 domain-containing protein [Acidimicrobiia bacterium]